MNSERLSAFLAREAGIATKWGVHDCATLVADWYMAATGLPDPIAQYRGTYGSEADCIKRWGRGYVLRLFGKILGEIGLPSIRGNETAPGDIGVIELRSGETSNVCGAIRTARGWIMRGESGFTSLPEDTVRVVYAWSLSAVSA